MRKSIFFLAKDFTSDVALFHWQIRREPVCVLMTMYRTGCRPPSEKELNWVALMGPVGWLKTTCGNPRDLVSNTLLFQALVVSMRNVYEPLLPSMLLPANAVDFIELKTLSQQTPGP
jgi:hypothetical protein